MVSLDVTEGWSGRTGEGDGANGGENGRERGREREREREMGYSVRLAVIFMY